MSTDPRWRRVLCDGCGRDCQTVRPIGSVILCQRCSVAHAPPPEPTLAELQEAEEDNSDGPRLPDLPTDSTLDDD